MNLPPIMLADSIPTWQSTVSVLALIGAAISFAFGGLTVFYMRKQTTIMAEALNKPTQTAISPQPFNVTISQELHKEFAAKDDFDQHVARTRSEFARVDQQRGDDLRANAASRKIMYDKQDDMRKELTDRIEDVNKRIDGIPERVISTLKNTGAI